MKLFALRTGIISWLHIPVVLNSLHPGLRGTIGCYRAQRGDASSSVSVRYVNRRFVTRSHRSGLQCDQVRVPLRAV